MESALALQSVDPNALEGITSFLAASEQPFSPSELYLPNDDAKVVDVGRRVSEYRVFTDPALFDYAETIVKQLSEASDSRDYVLVRNDRGREGSGARSARAAGESALNRCSPVPGCITDPTHAKEKL